jgi:hypothetical protein
MPPPPKWPQMILPWAAPLPDVIWPGCPTRVHHVVLPRETMIVQGPMLTFGDYPCTRDCSGHSAGYDWAAYNEIGSADDCPVDTNNSFYEGCLTWIEEQSSAAGP